MKRINVAVHLHTHYSFDSNVSPSELVQIASAAGLDSIAITDHDEIEGALRARDVGGLRVVVGEEVSTAHGHLIGLFLEERIPPGLSSDKTIDRIHAQGGLALAPHPFSRLCAGSLQAHAVRLANRLDAVETFNAQNPLPWEDRRAARFARDAGLPMYVGMDAHVRWLPAAYQIMPDFDSPQSFLRALRQAEFRQSRVGLAYVLAMGFRHLWDKFSPKPLPGFGVGRPAAEV